MKDLIYFMNFRENIELLWDFLENLNLFKKAERTWNLNKLIQSAVVDSRKIFWTILFYKCFLMKIENLVFITAKILKNVN